MDYLGKETRMGIVSDSGELDFKRTLLSSDPKLREKVKKLREITEGLRAKYPEMIGMTLFGSHVKGYANNQSDIDANIYIDASRVFLPITEHRKVNVLASPRFLRIQEELAQGISEAGLRAQSGGIYINLISKDQIIETCLSGSFSENIVRLFHLGAGKGIYEYREAVISTFESMGEEGEKRWSNLMAELSLFENRDMKPDLQKIRKNLYPKTLAEGRRYFLSHAPKDAGQS